jgi:hypothetical protein
MKSGQIIYRGKVVAETVQPRQNSGAIAKWAHLMGWNVDSYDESKGSLSSDCGAHKATLRIFDAD